jgi:hypothetical protein
MTPPAIRSASTRDAALLAGLRFEFRGAIDPVAETKAAFVERCAAWMTPRLEAAGAWRCRVADTGRAVVGTVWLELVEKLPNRSGSPSGTAT